MVPIYRDHAVPRASAVKYHIIPPTQTDNRSLPILPSEYGKPVSLYDPSMMDLTSAGFGRIFNSRVN